MTSLIETVKAKADIVDEIGQYVALRSSGNKLVGLCPLHGENTPSFVVYPEEQRYYCYGCHKNGDIFNFVEEYLSLDFADALNYLCERLGIVQQDYEGSGRTAEDRETSAVRERMRKMHEDAALWFQAVFLRSREATGAREYAESRGISSDSVMAFGIGYAPDQWDGLTHLLLARGYTERELVMGGLARERERDGNEHSQRSSGIYDYFRNRLMFPIRDMRGKIIGFGGRALGDGKPKYLNSPQTVLFEKSSVLYAIDMAREAIKQVGQVVIVEGYVDAIIAHQYGTRQTVACIGSAITEKHIQQLKKLTKQVTLALDPDAAGSAATEHGIQEALKSFDRTVVPVPLASGRGTVGSSRKSSRQPKGIIHLEEQVDAEINVLQLPAGEDPDELIRRDLTTWRYAVAHPLSLIDYYFVTKTADLNVKNPTGKSEAAKRLLPVIGLIRDRIKRDGYIRKLANLISVDERSLYAELQHVLKEQRSTTGLSVVTAPFSMPSQHMTGQRDGTDKRGTGAGANSGTGTRGNTGGNSRTSSGSPAPTDARRNSSPSGQESSQTDPEENRTNVNLLAGGLDSTQKDRLQWEDYLIGLLLLDPSLLRCVCGIINDGDFVGTDTRELYRILNSTYQRDPPPSHQSLEQFIPAVLLASVARVQQRIESGFARDDKGLEREAVQCAHRLKRLGLLQLNTELRYLINDAVEAGDHLAARQLQLQLQDIHRQLRTLYTGSQLQG